MRRTSAWLQEIMQEAKISRPVAIHVRRGDYIRVPSFGLLSRRYYEDALADLKRKGFVGPVRFFADDATEAMSLLGDFPVDRIVTSPHGPASEMLAMSNASAIVTANSTLSWWAARMSKTVKNVIAPQPWFRSAPPIGELIPPGWSRIRACWV